MARRILVRTEAETLELMELDADSESELQEVLRRAPNLVPVDDLGLDGPMMVAGRETTLPSGRVDLLGLTPSGEILVVEFKTGPNNPDYRHALAQLLDYGSDLWRMELDEFASTVTLAYLSSPHCPADDPARGAGSIREAARLTWPHLQDADLDAFEQRLTQRLSDGAFHFVLAAQRITANSRRTIEYLQETHATSKFHAVEVVKFTDGSGATVAYEGRAVTSPGSATTAARRTGAKGDPEAVLAAIGDVAYREALEGFLDRCRSLRLTFEAGSVGFSIRVSVPDRQEPVSLGWLFPPGTSGWMGLTGLNLGYDTGTVKGLSVASQFAAFREQLGHVAGVQSVTASSLDVVHVPPPVMTDRQAEISAAVADLVAEIAEAS